MGISGLLPLLKSIHKPCSLKQFAGQTIGVDAYGWLHRGTVACATELALDKPTTKFVDFAMSRVRMLKHFGITPYIVFDGDYLPSKSKTEKERAARRKDSKRLGMQLLELGKTAQAYLELQKAVDVTPEMAGQLIEQLKLANVQYVVAPYEADSQLAYLEQKGIINGILSEDSDLLVFGAKRLLTKLDQYGECVLIRRDDFTACKEVSLVGWSDREFRRMAIMSGCDYLANIDKMGLKTAHRLIRKHKTMERVIRAVQFDGKFKVPPGYLESFLQAEMTFLHQWVFCPLEKRLVNCNPLEEGIEVGEMPYIGKHVEPTVAAGVARGELHPHTKEPLRVTPVSKAIMYPPHGRNTPVVTPNLKKNKSIETFFQPKRTPLAELDPNSFASTPGQQNLLRRASGSTWPATPALQAATGTSSQRSLVPSSAPLTSRRPVSDHSLPRFNSDRMPKRRRLCTDGSSPVSAKDAARVESGGSKFFMRPENGASPSKQVFRKRTDGKTNTDFNLWSDDSIEEALLNLPDPESSHHIQTKNRKVKVFMDNTSAQQKVMATTTKSSRDEDISQETNITVHTQLFTQTSNKSTPPSSPDSTKPVIPSKNFLFAKHSLPEIRSLEKFSYNNNQNPPTQSTVSSEISRTKSAPSIKSILPEGSPYRRALPIDLPRASVKHESPADQVADRFASLDHPSGTDIYDNTASEGDWHVLPCQPDIDDSTRIQHDSEIMVPASDEVVPQSPLRALGNLAKVSCGSEDLLVVDSESEDGDVISPKAKPVFDLGRYMFGP